MHKKIFIRQRIICISRQFYCRDFFFAADFKLVFFKRIAVMNLSIIIKQYQSLLEAGKNFALIDTFYDDDIIQIENNEPPLKGKTILAENEKNNINGVYSFHQQIINIVLDEVAGIVMGEMQIKFHSKTKGRKIIHEAFIQKWQNEKICYQRFYYGKIENDEN
jgi:hypothetical protein